RTLPFSFRGGCFGILQSVRPDPCVHLVCLEWGHRGMGPWGAPQVFHAGEYGSSSITENHFRDNRCLEKVRCLGMFSHAITEKAIWKRAGRAGVGAQTAGKYTPPCATGASALRIYKAFPVC